VTVAEEVEHIYPEWPGSRQRLANDPTHVYFKNYGAQVPKDQWNERGTKQGIYWMGPDGEYLEAQFATAGADQVLERMRRAVERWKVLAQEKGYAQKPIPFVETRIEEPTLAGAPLLLHAHLRDLPAQEGDQRGRRFESFGQRNNEPWHEFTRWAFNENWIGYTDAKPFVTDQSSPVPVEPALVQRLAREVLVDNVRGQAPHWRETAVKLAQLSVRRTEVKGHIWTLEYVGRAEMEEGNNSYKPDLYGRATWNAKDQKFERFDMVANGMRTGAWTFNDRRRDMGPAPMGVAMSLYRP
jgi:hypothetical protein